VKARLVGRMLGGALLATWLFGAYRLSGVAGAALAAAIREAFRPACEIALARLERGSDR
jgi:hypothetical protein